MTITKEIITIEKIKENGADGEIEHEGICSRSPDGILWKIKIDNEGNITTEVVIE